jgi:hypothetical protein
MSLHDAYARLTPFELTFEDGDAAAALSERIQEEAAGRGADPDDPHQFVTMGEVGAFVAGLQGPEAPPEAIHSFAALVYHGVHFERAGRPLYVLSAHAARFLVDGAPEGTPRPPTAAGYLQLPQHLFWAEPVPGSTESVDGVFWTATPAGVLHSMLVTGMREDRPGLGVVPLPEAPLDDGPKWVVADVRDDGDDFATTLPGADLDRLYAFQAAGEVLKLLGRFFAYAASTPSALEAARPAGGEGPPRPSELPHARVTLG